MTGFGLAEAISSALGTDAASASRLGGGSINEGWRVELADGTVAFVKTRDGDPGAEFAAEAAALRWLAEPGTVRVPRVLGAGADWLALEWVEPGSLSTAGAEELGRGLAGLHKSGAEAHGSLPPDAGDVLRLATLELPAAPRASWPGVYVEQRIAPLLHAARERGAISAGDAAAVERVCERIDEVAGPSEPPARLHGDLWSGNVHADTSGSPWLIDPAAYGGHRETDLAMLALFGLPQLQRVLAAYEEESPLAEGWEDRVALHQLFPLLVHAALFGGGYGARAASAARSLL